MKYSRIKTDWKEKKANKIFIVRSEGWKKRSKLFKLVLWDEPHRDQTRFRLVLNKNGLGENRNIKHVSKNKQKTRLKKGFSSKLFLLGCECFLKHIKLTIIK